MTLERFIYYSMSAYAGYALGIFITSMLWSAA